MIVTDHARKRWEERFPGRDMVAEFTMSRRPGKATRRKLANQLSDDTRKRTRGGGRYYLVSKAGAEFVCTPPETIITTFPLTGNTDWKTPCAS